MKTLEFENTQGIRLQYITASVLERMLSFLLDLVILALLLFLLAVTFEDLFSSGSAMLYLLLGPVFIFYSLLFEVFNNGRSPGKLIVGLKVIRIDGKPVRGYDYLMRWMFRWLDIYMTLGTLAALMTGATPRAQRLGDMLADTTVIKVRQSRISLQRVLSLGQLDQYTPVYPQVLRLKEEQVLLVKETIDRAVKYDNPSHREALEQLAGRIAGYLEIPAYKNSRSFLNTIVKDFIALTR